MRVGYGRLLGPVPVGTLDYPRVQQFVAELQAVPLAPKTVRACYAVLAQVLAHAQRLGRLQRPIPKPILPKTQPAQLVVPTRGEVDMLAQASDARLWAPILLAGYCGLREGELLALLREDVNLAERWVLVRRRQHDDRLDIYLMPDSFDDAMRRMDAYLAD